VWGSQFRSAVESELRTARFKDLSYVEVGGWAISAHRRCTSEALRTALATYSLAQLLGGCLGITTATIRHASSSILRRIGGSSLRTEMGELPSYYDPQYGCEMEVLRFDSECPASKYVSQVDRLQTAVLSAPLVCETTRSRSWSISFANRSLPPAPLPAANRGYGADRLQVVY
jgi:hypothetical protein